ncbi:hypothetical protein UNDKW_0029 [Undibacterium sp. KW1]|uniref:DUF6985 domain-containing protein n=1 Tax=Undibacterium sp. KW1 TaxID=2058624 RepID=UPI001331F2B7|nr:hypothetical protein [Undibacterium sp. KW1]BBB58302.1 hypothetical protein UNDKW_0029 [Undibacterium sp. KW1]
MQIAQPSDVWQHIQYGYEALVSQRPNGDKTVYVSVECDCDWDVENGLQLVFRNGKEISKLGPFDDYLSNADAFGEASLDKWCIKAGADDSIRDQAPKWRSNHRLG